MAAGNNGMFGKGNLDCVSLPPAYLQPDLSENHSMTKILIIFHSTAPCFVMITMVTLCFRLFVISWFPVLQYLDDQAVTKGERMEAHRLYKRPLLERISNREPFSKVIKTVVSALGFDRIQNSSGTRSSFV